MNNLHQSANGIAIGLRPHQPDANALVPRRLIGAVEICRAIVGSDQQIEIAITVKVSVGKPATDLGLTKPASGRRRHIRKSSLPAIEKELRRLRIPNTVDIADRVVDMPIYNCQI